VSLVVPSCRSCLFGVEKACKQLLGGSRNVYKQSCFFDLAEERVCSTNEAKTGSIRSQFGDMTSRVCSLSRPYWPSTAGES
jgi:hypothetical protein